jgi:hypothetical protein
MSGTTKESHFSTVLTLFFTKLSTAKPAWYSIKALSSDTPSLLGLNYKTMIMLLHFAGFAGPGGKVFSADKLNTFISLNSLGQVLEGTHYRLKGLKGYYKCIGSCKLEMSITPGKAPTTLFGIHNIKQLQQELTDSVKKAAGKQLLKGSQGHHMMLQSMTATDENEEDNDTEELVVEQDPFNDCLHICIRSHLLPLLIHKDKIVLMTDLWNPNHTAQ